MRKVTILGASGPSNKWANSLPDDVELWGMNMGHRFLTRPAQRFFQIHHRMHNADSGNPPGHFGRPLDHEEFLQTCGIPVYMQQVDDAIPTSVRYPIEKVTASFGSYLTSTAAYMMALALWEGVDELGLLGIYMDTGTEYEKQRPCLEYYLGMARQMGVRVSLPPGCTLAQAPLYAYSEFEDSMDTLTLTGVVSV